MWALSAGHQAAAQAPGSPAPKYCGTPDIMKEYLAAHPEIAKRMAATEARTQRYIRQAEAAAQRSVPGPLPALLTIPVVVHVLWNTPNQNLSEAVIQSQIDELNLGFRGPTPGATPVPAAFAPLVADARLNFCLATRDPSGSPTTGITRRNTSATVFGSNTMMLAANGGTNPWNPTQYLNIWCCNLPSGEAGFAVFPGPAITTPTRLDGVALIYNAFGRGHAALDARYTLGRVAVHEVGHWLDLLHIWGGNGDSCLDSDLVSDTPNQGGFSLGTPIFPLPSACAGASNGAMFMNHMDYVDDGSKRMFSTGQALRMQATFGPGGSRESLKNSPALNPVLSIVSSSARPATLFCGDQTDYNFRPASNSVGCGGGYVSYQWRATSPGWTVNYSDSFYPEIIPDGISGSTITLTGIYTNAAGMNLPLNAVNLVVGFNPLSTTPVFTGNNPMRCSGTPRAFTVGAVPGATAYHWTVPAGFTAPGQVIANGQTTTTAPSLLVVPNAGLAGDTYAVQCRAQVGRCPVSDPATRSFSANGGPLLKIVNSDPAQNHQGFVCAQNIISLELVPVLAGASAPARNINWSPGARNRTTLATPGFPLRASYYTNDVGWTNFRVTASYVDSCGTTRAAVPYDATTFSASSSALNNGYNCVPYRYRSATPTPYPNPATDQLQLPGYQGQVVVYNQQGKPMQHLLAPGTDYGATVDTSTWPDGLYVVTGRSLTGEFVRHNVQIQH